MDVPARSGLRNLMVGAVLALVAMSPATADAWTLEELDVTRDDGVVLRGHVYKPDTPGPHPTILEYSPYWGAAGAGFFRTGDAWGNFSPYDTYLVNGFAVALVNMRGTGDSDGCLDFGGRVDAADAAAVVEALAAKPWSNGSVGMTGHSSPAWAAFLATTAAPEGLKAVVAMSSVIDVWSLSTRHGAVYVGLGGMTMGAYATALTAGRDDDAVEHVTCPELRRHSLEFAELGRSAAITDYWKERDLRDGLRDTEVPVLVTNGLWVIGEGHILQIEGLWDLLRPNRTRMILGNWGHEPPDNFWGNGVSDWNREVVGWFDHYLRGGPKTVATGVVDYQDGDGTWHQADRWPPASEPEMLRLSAGSSLVSDQADVEPGDATFRSAETDPGPAPQQAQSISLSRGPGAIGACGPHNVLYVSPPLESNALLAGNVKIDVTITSSEPGGNLSVFLWKTTGKGSCGDLSASAFGRAMLDLRHWRKDGRPQSFPVAKPTGVTLTSHPFASQLESGERIVVAIGGGNSELAPDPLHPVITVHSGKVELPVVDGALELQDP